MCNKEEIVKLREYVLSYGEIASKLGISKSTVVLFVEGIKRRMNLRKATALTVERK